MINWINVVKSNAFANCPAIKTPSDEGVEEYRPNKIDYRLKDRFWSIYAKSIKQNKKYSIEDIVFGICSVTNFYQTILPNRIRLSWILKPQEDFKVLNEVLISKALDSAYELIDLSPVGQDGKPNMELIGLQVKVIDAILKMNTI